MTDRLDVVGWPIRTERLVLRRATVADAEATYRFRKLDEVGRWITRQPRSLDEHLAHFAEPAHLAATIVIELDDEVVGDLMLKVEDAWAQAEIADQARAIQAELGWTLDPAFTGRGLATEAVEALIDICFERLGLRRVTAGCFAANDASWRLMERIGMRREQHTVRDSLHRDGEWLDGYTYAILADEWRSRRLP